MQHRKLRIAWSAAWGVVVALLIALSVRSHYRRDVVGGTIFSHEFVIESVDGSIAFLSYYLNPAYSASPFGISSYGPTSTNYSNRLNYQWLLKDWALAVLFTFVGVAAWIDRRQETGWRFSLRTLLVATTLVAVVFGLVAYAIK